MGGCNSPLTRIWQQSSRLGCRFRAQLSTLEGANFSLCHYFWVVLPYHWLGGLGSSPLPPPHWLFCLPLQPSNSYFT